MNSTKTLATMTPNATGLRTLRVSESGGLFGARVRNVDATIGYLRSLSVGASPRAIAASRVANPSHVAATALVMDDAWAAKKGHPAPRGGPA